MKTETKRTGGNSIVRLAFAGVSLLFQIGWLLALILWLNEYFTVISLISSVLSLVLVVKLYSKHTNSAMKMPWIMLIMAFPVMGLSMYLLFGLLGDPGVGKRLAAVREKLRPRLEQEPGLLEGLDPDSAGHCRYLQSIGWPAYSDTRADYLAEGKGALEAMKRDLEQAERFIFMEYFIVEDRSSFREIEEILVRKVRQGVQVRLMYDDIGSVGYVNLLFARRLRQEGIQCSPFNPALPMLNLFMNHRDHRKITVIDGKVGYTGGYNLADCYFDRERPFGYWKDTGLRLEGQAVRSLTAAFLELWSVQHGMKEDWTPYLDADHRVSGDALVQPYADDPLGHDRVAEDVYLNMISQADESLYLITPYLIITDELSRALRLAARRGVDVRIITPGIPDKRTVYAVTRSYYAALCMDGVRVFEYTPGFCHAKMCVADGLAASIGTSNLDYRSLYHHFENNVLLVGGQAVADIQRDFQEMFRQCREVTEKYRSGRGAMLRIWQCILRLFAPLM